MKRKIWKLKLEALKKKQKERGQKIIEPIKLRDWNNFVDKRAKDTDHGKYVNYALDIMEMIAQETTLEEQLEVFNNQNHDEESASIVRIAVLTFSYYEYNAMEFYKATSPQEWTEEDEIIANNIRDIYCPPGFDDISENNKANNDSPIIKKTIHYKVIY